MLHLPESPPIEKIITEGPVLCLDIDGVCSPIDRVAYSGSNRIEDFVPLGHELIVDRALKVVVHQDLRDWIRRLDQSFAARVWLSSWRARCAYFAASANLEHAVDWPYLLDDLLRKKAMDDTVDLKAQSVCDWVSRDVAVAIVDDHLLLDMGYTTLFENFEPTPLLIYPATKVGITEGMVEMLVDYASNPHALGFTSPGVWVYDVEKSAMEQVWGAPWISKP